MTREDALRIQLFTGWQSQIVETELGKTIDIQKCHDFIINKIYDDFEEKLNIAESEEHF